MLSDVKNEESEVNVWYGKFKMLDVDYNIDYPQLVLATDIHNPYYVSDKEYKRKYDFEFIDDREFLKIEHECGGAMCDMVFMSATILKPKENVKNIIIEMNNKWKSSGIMVPKLDEMVEYRDFIKNNLNVDCQETYWHFSQGLYPIDATIKNIQNLCVDELPDDLDDLVVWSSDEQRIFGIKRRWKIFILGENE